MYGLNIGMEIPYIISNDRAGRSVWTLSPCICCFCCNAHGVPYTMPNASSKVFLNFLPHLAVLRNNLIDLLHFIRSSMAYASLPFPLLNKWVQTMTRLNPSVPPNTLRPVMAHRPFPLSHFPSRLAPLSPSFSSLSFPHSPRSSPSSSSSSPHPSTPPPSIHASCLS